MGAGEKKKPPNERNDSRRSQLRVGQGQGQGQSRRRSGSLVYGKDPRQSNTSYRSTRERIVVVDESGRRTEYYRRDDSGR